MMVPAEVKETIESQVHDQRVNVNASVLQQANKDSTTMGLIGIKTKYMEDVFIGKHTSVWGSYFDA